MINEEEIREKILVQALINAVKHEGKAEYKVVVSKIAAEEPELRSRIKELLPVIKEIVEKVNSLGLDKQKQMLLDRKPDSLVEGARKEEKKGLPPLPNVRKGTRVKTRFAPNPDFLIHLGNARPAILSYEYARLYKGKMILRFEDTDPRIKTPLPEAYHLIREDLKWLGIKWDEEYIQSLRMHIYYEIARKLIERGGAFVDTLPKSEYTLLLESGKPHPNREKPPEENLLLFDKMLSGFYGEGEAVLRVKTRLDYRDKSLIDWVAFRIIDTDKNPHPITGSRYIVWPTYNFAAAVDDYLMGVTHVLRGKEHKQNTIKQQHLYQHMGWRQPTAIHLGRLKLEGFIMSKSFIKKMLSEEPEKFMGPDDPRFATIRGLRRRGIRPETIKKTIMEVGAKKSDASISFANLAAENRKIIDPQSPRLMYVEEPVILKVRMSEKCVEANIPYHPENKSLGSRSYHICDGDEIALSRADYEQALDLYGGIRLMGLGNFKIEKRELDMQSRQLEDARKRGWKIIQWVPFKQSRKCNLIRPAGEELLTSIGLIEDTSILREYVDSNIQLVRIGFARIEKIEPLVEMVFSHE